jgi:peroxiredoxin family protein
VLECSTFLILTHIRQNRHRLTSQTIRLDQCHSSQSFFDASKQVKVTDGEIGEVTEMWSFSAAEAHHRVNSRMRAAASRILKMQSQLGMRVAACHTPMKLRQ